MAEFEAAEEAAEDEGPALPTSQNDEFRPFVRRYFIAKLVASYCYDKSISGGGGINTCQQPEFSFKFDLFIF